MRRFHFVSILAAAFLLIGALTILTSGCGEKKDSNDSLILLLMNGTSASLNRIFVTNSFYYGNLGGISGADNGCMNDANKPTGGSGKWKALIAAEGRTYSNNWVLKPNTTYYRADGTTEIFTTNADGIFEFSGSFTNSIAADEMDVWTGMDDKWANAVNADCNDWTNDTVGYHGYLGDSMQTDSRAIYQNDWACNNNARFICVEQ